MLLIIITLLFSTNAVPADAHNRTPYYVTNAANTFNVDSDLLMALCDVESHCNPYVVSYNDGTKKQKLLGIKVKSIGMFQIQLATARLLGFTGTAKELMKPAINSYYAAKLLSIHYNEYGSTTKALSSYNAGKPIKGNMEYVNSVVDKYVEIKSKGKI